MSKPIPQSVRQQVLHLLQKGLRYRAIVRVLNISCSTIKRWQGQFDHGIEDWAKGRRPSPTSEVAQFIVERYLEVGSFQQVAKEFGVSDGAVRRYYMNILKTGHPFLAKGQKPHPSKVTIPMSPKLERPQRVSARKPRTTASYEKEIRELNILVSSLLTSMEHNLDGVKKSP